MIYYFIYNFYVNKIESNTNISTSGINGPQYSQVHKPFDSHSQVHRSFNNLSKDLFLLTINIHC